MAKNNGRINLEAFARAIASGRTNYESYKAAGGTSENKSSVSVATSRLLRKPNVMAMLEEAKAPIIDKSLEIQRSWLEKVAVIGDTGKLERDRLKAFELIGRYFSMFTDKHELKVSIPVIEIKGSDGKALVVLTSKDEPKQTDNPAAPVPAESTAEPCDGN